MTSLPYRWLSREQTDKGVTFLARISLFPGPLKAIISVRERAPILIMPVWGELAPTFQLHVAKSDFRSPLGG